MEEWLDQLHHFVNTLDRLRDYIHVTDDEARAIEQLEGTWGTTPYFASLMDPDDPECPIRRQVVPSLKENENRYGVENYLVWKENRATDEVRPECIGRQYRDRVAFLVTDVCANYCRHCFRKELVVARGIRFRFDLEQGLDWLREHTEVRDVLLTGGDPFLLSDERLEYLIETLREIPHVQMIRFGTRLPIVLPQRVTPGLKKVLEGNHAKPIWVNTQCNHPRELTEEVRQAVYDLLTCGVNVGNQAVLLKGINDDPETFRELHLKLVHHRIRPYYVFYCEPAPGIDHFRTPPLKGAELIRDCLRGHTTGLATPLYCVATHIGKILLMPDYCIAENNEDHLVLRNYEGKETTLPQIPE